MRRLLDRFSRDDPAFRLEADGAGVVLIRQDGQAEPFNAIARDLINEAGNEFLVFPTTDGAAGYERVFILPL